MKSFLLLTAVCGCCTFGAFADEPNESELDFNSQAMRRITENGDKIDAESIALFRKGAAAGEFDAMLNLASCAMTGRGMAKNPAECVKQLLAAEKLQPDNPYLLHWIGSAFHSGAGIKKDVNKAIEYYSRAAKSGSRDALTKLGLIYARSRDVPRDYNKALQCYGQADAARDPVAANELGFLHYYGRGTPKNRQTALKYFLRAAFAGHVAARNNVGFLLSRGLGVPKPDPQAGAVWYDKAASAGFAPAQYNLAELCYAGEGVPKDDAKARTLLDAAAKKGYAKALYMLGFFDLNGIAGPKDESAAFRHYLASAEKGEPFGVLQTARMYEQGIGTAADPAKAAFWRQRAGVAEPSPSVPAKENEEDMEDYFSSPLPVEKRK